MSIENCQTPNATDATKCDRCNYQYTLNENKTVCLTDSFCSICQTANATCKSDGTQSCVQCTGTSFERGTKCASNVICANCSNTQICTFNTYTSIYSCNDCSQGQNPSPDRTTCISTTICDRCTRDQKCIPNAATMSCVNCDAGQPAITDKTSCLDVEFCRQCYEKGQICNPSGVHECTSCDKGTAPLDIFSCRQVCTDKNCAFCYGGKCLICDAGHKLDNRDNCVPAACKTDKQCREKYGNATCMKGTDGFSCECQSEYIFSANKTQCISAKICSECNRNSQVCVEKQSEMVCQDCHPSTTYYNKICEPSVCNQCTESQTCVRENNQFVCKNCPPNQLTYENRCYNNNCGDCSLINPIFTCQFSSENFSQQFICKCPVGTKLSFEGKCEPDHCSNCDGRCVELKTGFFCVCKAENYAYQNGKCSPDCRSGKFCNFNGFCQPDSTVCRCTKNFDPQTNCKTCIAGSLTVNKSCLAESCFKGLQCTDNGKCQDKVCICHDGHDGPNCERCLTGYILVNSKCQSESCSLQVQCNNNGQCIDNKCKCESSSFGADCQFCKEGYLQIIKEGISSCEKEGAVIVQSGQTGVILIGIFGFLLACLIIGLVVLLIKNRVRKPQLLNRMATSADLLDAEYEIGSAAQ
ncbi:Cysteine-rich membrane protein 2 [Spironucleus salmonicida]|uniref:Cysteine-rich membrane protein 2 n=1 Tax=Spironucleus salmonicida TaxID=348837 RepID=V6LQR2_9EUKA|nr:Cysteine-rich membrane protein 2 [Spironucleus salmonicida]|eukprot:EST43094.1 Cysteine-rich membrane protein 2 [Spironucleus salmonicida]